MSPCSWYVSTGTVWVLGNEGGENQCEWLSLRGSVSSWMLALVPNCLSSTESHFDLALLSLHDSPYGCGSSHCPLADLLRNHLRNRSKIFRRADGDWWKWSCQLHWILQVKIHRFGYAWLGAAWWWCWLFLIPSLHVSSNLKFVSAFYYSYLFFKSLVREHRVCYSIVFYSTLRFYSSLGPCPFLLPYSLFCWGFFKFINELWGFLLKLSTFWIRNPFPY